MNQPLESCITTRYINNPLLTEEAVKYVDNPKTIAFEQLSTQILEIGKTDPERASRLSKKLALCDCTFKDLKELQELGLDTAGIPAVRGLLGGAADEWMQGSALTLSGNTHETKIFHIPRGYRYRNYRRETWQLSPGASCSVTYVVANSKDSIEQLKSYSSKSQVEAALSAMISTGGEPPHSGGGSLKFGKSSEQDHKGQYSSAHGNEAVVVTAETKNVSCLACFPSTLDVSIQVHLERE